MPGTTPPSGGIQGFWAQIQQLAQRIAAIEVRERQVVAIVPGTITRWPVATPPAGAFVCNGATFSAATYPELYTALGNSNVLPNIAGTPIYIIWH